MSEISDYSIILFVVSGIFFAIALLVFCRVICCGQDISKTNEDRLIILDEVLFVHTEEYIDCPPQAEDLKKG